jgi:hypothetical protein
MKLVFAQTISFIFNPLTVILFAPFILVYRTTHDADAAVYWSAYTLIFLMVLALFAIIAVKKKIFTDLDISKREQRPLMFLVSLLLISAYIVSLFILHGPFILYVLAISSMLGVSFVSVINRRIKASIHMAAITALILPVAISFGQYYLLLLFLLPLVGWARIKTKRHTLPEVLVGSTVGGLLSLSVYIAIKVFFNK